MYGVLTSISPVKKGRKQNYFEGTVTDGSSKLRLVGFNTKLQKQISDMMSKKPIEIKIVRSSHLGGVTKWKYC